MSARPAAAMFLCLALCNCDRVAEPHVEFGYLTAVLNGKAWASEARPDSVIASYDSTSGRLIIWGEGHNRFRQSTTIGLETCQGLAQRRYDFAQTPRGPYGPNAWKQGFVGDFWGPLNEGKWSELYILEWFQSHGAESDSISIDLVDRGNRIVRGTFQMTVFSEYGNKTAAIRGVFFGRFEYKTLNCSVLGDP